jgi:response regulator NasT
MRVWLLEGKQGEDRGLLAPRLRQWLEHTGQHDWAITVLGPEADFNTAVAGSRPDVIVLPIGRAVPPGLEEVLHHGSALVIASSTRCAATLSLGSQYPVHFMPDDPDPDCLGLIIVNARSNLRRLNHWRVQVEQLQHRLNDRILIDRAKGVLIQRLGISEEQAYRRLRLLSRRQRRPIADVAEALLSSSDLLLPLPGDDEEPEAEHRPTHAPLGESE